MPVSSADGATATPTVVAAGGSTMYLGMSEDLVQIVLSLLIAIVISVGILFVFNNLNRSPKRKKPSTGITRGVSPKQSSPNQSDPKQSSPRPPAPKASEPPVKRKDAVESDDIYGLVLGGDGKV